jgi:hypothetical protein
MMRLATEAPVNGGRNCNGPKVANFLVGEVPTRTRGVTIWVLSRRETRRNRLVCEFADYVHLGRRPYDALLYRGIELGLYLRSIGGRL